MAAYVTFQMAEVAVPGMFGILSLIARFRHSPARMTGVTGEGHDARGGPDDAKQRVSARQVERLGHLGYQRVGSIDFVAARLDETEDRVPNSPSIRGMSAQTWQSPRRYPRTGAFAK